MCRLILLIVSLFPLPDWVPNYDFVRGKIMATGDITATIPNVDGGCIDLTVEGFSTGATWDVGNGDGTALEAYADAVATLTLTGNGYNADGTVNSSATYTSNLNAVRRKAHPNNADEEQADVSGDLKIRFNTDRWLWTGYTATLTASAGLVNDAGGANGDSNAASAISVTNSSSLAPPKVLGQWDMQTSITGQRVSGDFTIGFHAYHHTGIACVKFSVTGGTSAHEETATVTTKAKRASANTGLYGEAYEATIDTSSFTDGETLTINAIAYPNVGASASVLDTSDTTTDANECLLRSDLSFYFDSSGSLTEYAVVDTGSGNDGTGVVSTTKATAEASPYATIEGAIEDGATEILLTAGTHTLTTSSPGNTNGHWTTIRADDGEDASTVTVEIGSIVDTNCTRTKFDNLTLNATNSGNTWLSNGGHFMWFHRVTFDWDETVVGPGYNYYATYLTECDGTSATNFSGFSTSRTVHLLDGCSIAKADFNVLAHHVVRCSGDMRVTHETSSGRVEPDGCMILFNNMEAADRDSWCVNLTTTDLATSAGYAIIGNLFERHGTGAATSALVTVYADSNTQARTNVVMAHNTIVGERWNYCYNDTGTASVTTSNILAIGNVAVDGFNIKADLFGTANANRVGNFALGHGTGSADNLAYDTTLSAVATAMEGAHGPGSSDSGGTDPLDFVDDQSLTSVGNAGGGDYNPDAGGNLIATLGNATPLISFDQQGNSVYPATSAAGAFQLTPAALDPSGAPAGDTGAYMNAGEAAVYIVYDANIAYAGGTPYPVTVTNGSGSTELTLTTTIVNSNTIKATFSGDTPANGDTNWTVTISNGSGKLTTSSNGAPLANQSDLEVGVVAATSTNRSRDRSRSR